MAWDTFYLILVTHFAGTGYLYHTNTPFWGISGQTLFSRDTSRCQPATRHGYACARNVVITDKHFIVCCCLNFNAHVPVLALTLVAGCRKRVLNLRICQFIVIVAIQPHLPHFLSTWMCDEAHIIR